MTAKEGKRIRGVEQLQERLGYTFSDPNLVRKALTHRSYQSDESDARGANERLEFLGDAVLGFLVAQRLFAAKPNASEGELTRARARLVKKTTLAEVARSLQLGDRMRVGKGVRLEGGNHLDSILSDTYEALLGAVYLDGGLAACERALDQWLDRDALLAEEELSEKDPKSLLQEAVQGRHKTTPTYVLIEASEGDNPFHVGAQVNGRTLGEGRGKTKGEAEQSAARQALASFLGAAAE